MPKPSLTSLSLDNYGRRARLQPALLTALPIALAVFAWFPPDFKWATLWSLLSYAGGTALLAQVARDRGRNKQADLFTTWGGKPTTCRLRHRDTDNAVLLARRHSQLQRLLPDLQFPNAEEEAADPRRADAIYESATAFLLERTRDQKKFPLVFEENCNYGFRRNLWGLRPAGIIVTLGGVAALLLGLAMQRITFGPTALAAGIVDVALLCGWLFLVTPQWVRLPADAYAERLLAATEQLSSEPKTKKASQKAK
jgi:hypothetical protein